MHALGWETSSQDVTWLFPGSWSSFYLQETGQRWSLELEILLLSCLLLAMGLSLLYSTTGINHPRNFFMLLSYKFWSIKAFSVHCLSGNMFFYVLEHQDFCCGLLCTCRRWGRCWQRFDWRQKWDVNDYNPQICYIPTGWRCWVCVVTVWGSAEQAGWRSIKSLQGILLSFLVVFLQGHQTFPRAIIHVNYLTTGAAHGILSSASELSFDAVSLDGA